ncbi:MAG TPA: alanine racemase, partial [Acidimicrobiales bacterium]|nr:alanine racemase [Acidimicrobiales bacterium]
MVDLEVLDRNLTAMATQTNTLGVALRPHAKTHKCVEIARRQVTHGAIGLSVATIGEAEVFADAGFDDLFVAYPLWVDAARSRRVASLVERSRLRVGVDSAAAAAALGHVAGSERLEVLV